MSFHKRTIRDISVDRKTVLVRADYNVPLKKDGTIADDLRIRASLPTLRYLLRRNAKVVIISHLGRPEGRDESLSLEVVASHLSELLKREVKFVEDCIGEKVVQAVKKSPTGSVILLENLRFYEEEEKNGAVFARKIAQATGARYFVQDGFGVVHRAHASTAAITNYIPSVAGLLLKKEYHTITSAMETPKRPLVAILGGAKISDKISVIERFVDIADKIIIGGAMANTFLAYKGHKMGASVAEKGQEAVLDRIYMAAHRKLEGSIEDFIILPTDVAVAKEPSKDAKRRNFKLGNVAAEDMALDIGDESIDRFAEELKDAKTVIWNGPMGYSSVEAFAHGSARLALQLATQDDTKTIIGGGDTAEFILNWSGGDGSAFSHISTGGGASLDLMAGQKLPGVECLLDAPK